MSPNGTGARPRRWRRLRVAGVGALVLLVVVAAAQTTPLERIEHFSSRDVSVIAHAGAAGHAPHNTIEAFELAVEMGADTLEMDLQLTADDHVVVMHDGTVDRTTDGSGRVRDLTLEEIRALDAGSWWPGPDGDHPYRDQGVRVPTLAEVFEAFPDEFMVIELKTDSGPGIIAATAQLIDAHDRHDSVVVASFDSAYLREFRESQPSVATSLGESEVRTFYALQLAGLHRWYRPPGEVLQVPEYFDDRHVTTARFLRAAARLGLDVQVWTVNEPEDMRRLIDAGVDGIMTDYPDRLLELLGR